MNILIDKISEIQNICNDLIIDVFGKTFDTSGNIGIFAQSDEEYMTLKNISEGLIKLSDNPNQKYFELIKPITIQNQVFTHLYIRKFDSSEYGKNLGDIDFVTDKANYDLLKRKVVNNDFAGATMYDRPGWDTIQITKFGFRAVSYLTTQEFAEKVRVKFDSLTKL